MCTVWVGNTVLIIKAVMVKMMVLPTGVAPNVHFGLYVNLIISDPDLESVSSSSPSDALSNCAEALARKWENAVL